MVRFVWLAFFLMTVTALPLWAAPLSPRLQAALLTAVKPLPVIVRMKGMDARARVQGLSHKTARRVLVADLKQQARQSQGPLLAFLRNQGVVDPTSLWLINGLAFAASPQLIAQLQDWPGVELISENQTVPRPVVMPAAAAAVEWNIARVKAPQLWDLGIDGTGVVVANLDTGVDVTHPDLSGSWRGGTNSWFDPYTGSSLPYDTGDGHGTAVMGLMVGGSAGGSAIGMAPGAQWIAAKIFPDTGPATNARILQAFGWVLDPDENSATDDGADIVNNSWGYDDLRNQCLSGSLLTDFQVALTNLRAADVAVVFAAGNTGPFSGSSIPPGNMSGALAVGAVDSSSVVARFSARGPSPCDAPGEHFPSLVAPGMSVRSTDLASSYVTASGTSFSAPQVAGALALLRQAFPPASTSMATLEMAVRQMALDLGTQGDDDIYGSGLLDVEAAYNLLADVNPVLLISDPTPPAADGHIDFGSVAPLNSRRQPLIIKNGGGGLLAISAVDDSTLDPAFRLENDLCTGQTLAGGESCRLDLVFTPPALAPYASGMSVYSADPAGPHSLTLSGLGNNAPPTPLLLLPAAGAVGVARPVDFSWQRDPDLDGDPVTDYLLLSALGDFSDSTPITTALPQAVLLIAGGGLCWGLRGSGAGRGWLLLSLIGVLLLLQTSCGGGSASTASAPHVPTDGYQSTSLLPNTTYYWKVRAVDSRGGVSESPVRSFTTGS